MKSIVDDQELRAVVDASEVAFKDCWRTLIALKTILKGGLSPSDLYRFQPTLSRALFELDGMYRKTGSERSELVAKGGKRSTEDVERLRAIARKQEILKSAMVLGRSIGDAFAWFFYVQSPDLLKEHFAHPVIAHTPPGLGGAGELAFLDSIRSDSHFVLYHGITTFLRVGDFSFVEHGSWTVTSLGEIKTSFVSEGIAKISLIIVGNKQETAPKLWLAEQQPKLAIVGPQPPISSNPLMASRIAAKLERQVQAMTQAIAEQPTDSKLSVEDTYASSELGILATRLVGAQSAYVKIGKGLLVCGLRISTEEQLAERLFKSGEITSHLSSLAAVGDEIKAILVPERTDNNVEVGNIDTTTRMGFLPLFWWNADATLLEDIYFGKVMLLTMYNSIYLLDALRARGYEVAQRHEPGRLEFDLEVREGKRLHRIENFYFFRALVSHQLMTERAVLEMIGRFRDVPHSDVPTRIELSITHSLQV